MYGSDMLWQKIELTITSWILESGGELFQYKSNLCNERQQFRATQFLLPLPKNEIYYFFHLLKKKVKEDRYQFYLQRRHQPISCLQDRADGVSIFKLIGGVKLTRQQTKKGRKATYMYPISANHIQRKIIYGKYQQSLSAHPYAVVKSFNKGYPLRTGQSLRFGKAEFNIIQVNTNLVREVDFGSNDQQVLNLDTKQSIIEQTQRSGESPSQCGRQCKICLMSEEQPENMLIAPCSCSGTTRHIHLQCLKEWIQQKLNKLRDSEGAFYQTNLLFCEICHQKFPKTIIKNGKKYGLLKFLQESSPYISIVPKKQPPSDNIFYISFQGTHLVTVGRLVQNGVVLQQTSVSRKHAAIKYEKERMMLKDEESKYGTLVHEDNMRIRLGKNLKAFQISNIVFSFKIIEDKNY